MRRKDQRVEYEQREQSTELRAQSTEHRASSILHLRFRPLTLKGILRWTWQAAPRSGAIFWPLPIWIPWYEHHTCWERHRDRDRKSLETEGREREREIAF